MTTSFLPNVHFMDFIADLHRLFLITFSKLKFKKRVSKDESQVAKLIFINIETHAAK